MSWWDDRESAVEAKWKQILDLVSDEHRDAVITELEGLDRLYVQQGTQQAQQGFRAGVQYDENLRARADYLHLRTQSPTTDASSSRVVH